MTRPPVARTWPMTAESVIRLAGRARVRIEVVAGIPLLSGATEAVRAAWRPVVERHREEIVRLLAPPAPEPRQLEIGGVRR